MLSIFLLICLTFSYAYASDQYTYNDYQKVIDRVNSEYGLALVIEDKDAFTQNVYNVITPSDLYGLLSARPSNSDFSTVQQNTPIKPSNYSIMARPNENITYKASVVNGSWTGNVYATIETKFYADNHSTFVRFINAKGEWPSGDTNYRFKATGARCLSCSSSECTVKYQGVWGVPATGVIDTTLYYYTITYKP